MRKTFLCRAKINKVTEDNCNNWLDIHKGVFSSIPPTESNQKIDIHNRTGVYVIYNRVTGDSYVGSTMRGIRRRLIDHKLRLLKNKHANPKLQNSWNKYGEDAFLFLPLEFTTKNLCIEREQFWMDKVKPSLNIRLIAESNLGLKFPLRIKKESSETNDQIEENNHRTWRNLDEADQEDNFQQLMKRTNIYFADQQIKTLKQLSDNKGISVAEIVRRAIDEYLGKQERKG